MSAPKSSSQPRLRRVTPERMIPLIYECKGMLSVVAKRMGVSYEAARQAVHKYPTVAKALQQAREEITDMAELALYRCIQEGQGWAVAFYLRTIGKSRGYVERHELTGADGDAIPIRWVEVVKTAGNDGTDDSR